MIRIEVLVVALATLVEAIIEVGVPVRYSERCTPVHAGQSMEGFVLGVSSVLGLSFSSAFPCFLWPRPYLLGALDGISRPSPSAATPGNGLPHMTVGFSFEKNATACPIASFS